MSDDDVRLPQLLPVLSRGKHRSPKKGACFMELASFLAGERWSDHPACSHPLLAALARDVNDCTSDTSRQRLAELIPSVIGLTSDDPHVDALIALRCATTALPVVSAERQRAMAVAILTCNRVIANLDGRPSGSLDERSRQALVDVPEAARWARRFTSDMGPSRRRSVGTRRRASSASQSKASRRRASQSRTTCCGSSSPGRSVSVSPGLTPRSTRPSLPPSTGPQPRSPRCRRNRADRQRATASPRTASTRRLADPNTERGSRADNPAPAAGEPKAA